MLRIGKRHFKSLMLILSILMVFSLNLLGGQIKGTLIDKETKEPIIGASVMLEGTTKGSVSDFDGNYIIREVESGTYKIKISSLEYSTVIS